MRAEELRIGNTLQRLDGSVFNVTIHDLELIHTWTANGRLLPQGIPLTEDWLLKAEFKKEDNSWFSVLYTAQIQDSVIKLSVNLKSGSVSIIDWDEGTPAYIGYSVKYVHQLQNIYFALTGKEL